MSDQEEKMIPLRVAVDTVLCKLSEAKPGDVLVIRADDWRDAHALAEALCRITLPEGSLPPGGVPVLVVNAYGASWTLEQLPATKDKGSSNPEDP